MQKGILGLGFSDEVSKAKNKKIIFTGSSLFSGMPVFSVRYVIFMTILILSFSFIFARLFFVTLINGDKFRAMATENRIREEKVMAPRGIIYDRNNIPLVVNIPFFRTGERTVFFKEKPEDFDQSLFEGVTREYPLRETVAHTVGYVSEASAFDVNQYEKNVIDRKTGNADLQTGVKYKAGDIVGKMGIEKIYDSYLRGIDGKQLIESDASGKTVRVLGKVEARAGSNLSVTIDSTLQETAARALDGRTGAVVVSIPKTGEILVLFSSPSFDPNLFILGTGVSSILNSPDRALFNRAIQGTYPPASTFKIITALAGLEEGVISRETTVEDTGFIEVNGYKYANWYFTSYGRKEGSVNIVDALKRSNDIYFYRLGEFLGINNLARFAGSVYTGKLTGVDLEGEEAGLMPDPAWQDKVKQEPWYLGNTFNTAIGQGDLLATPLQVNLWTNLIANRGKICTPHLVKDETVIKVKKSCTEHDISEDSLALIGEGMKAACQNGGTGWPLFDFAVSGDDASFSGLFKADNLISRYADGRNYYEIKTSTASASRKLGVSTGCKTGTAETFEGGKPHAWFTVFAPFYDPEISLTVILEHAGEGSSEAGPVAKEILNNYFLEKLKRDV